MSVLSQIANDIFLGQREVWNFLDYAVNRNLGDLMTYTNANQYREFQTELNYKKTDEYSKIKTPEKKYYLDSNDGKLKESVAPLKDIGAIYTVPNNDTATIERRGDTGEEKFTELNGEIREKEWMRYTSAIKPNLYFSESKDGVEFQSEYTIKKDIENRNSEYSDGLEDAISNIMPRNGTSKYVVNNSVREYAFYQEKGNDSSSKSDHVTQGSQVSLESFDNASQLLNGTNRLFRNSKISSLINRFYLDETEGGNFVKGGDLVTSYNEIYGLSRGRNLVKKIYENGGSSNETGYNDPYCRVWTAAKQYSKLKDRIRSFITEENEFKTIDKLQSNYGNLRPNQGANRLSNYSVLDANGYVKIGPYLEDFQGDENSNNNIKRYMFSIENLAWRDVKISSVLSKEQQGPNGGRIMWFPPYNLRFNENVNVDWTSNTFIGRGEKIYTYVNTDRQGTLSFTLLIDHPAIVNKWRGTETIEGEDKERKQRDLLRFFAGCEDLNDEVEPTKQPKEKSELPAIVSIEPKPSLYTREIAYVIFFPNNFSANDYINGDIEEGIEILRDYNSGGKTEIRDDSYSDEIVPSYNQVSEGFNPRDYEDEIKEHLFNGVTENVEIHYFDELENISDNFTGSEIYGIPSINCEILGIETRGFASDHGYATNNNTLCNRRRKFIEKMLQRGATELSPSNAEYSRTPNQIIRINNIDGRKDINAMDAKIARAAYAIINLAWYEYATPDDTVVDENGDVYINAADGATSAVRNVNLDNVGNVSASSASTVNEVSGTTSIDLSKEYKYDNEYLYFSQLNSPEQNMVLKNIIDKVRYFSPAFHSITPEGFNARLTFLQQCTRQGPTNSISGGNVNESSNNFLKYAGNLSFGRAPYCILRIGDFFHTKIIINSLSVNYDMGNGVQWDLNPEGVGVQPMFANVDITFTFVGGQDISGPIARLQNAVTSNYYANASIYSHHADTDTKYYDAMSDEGYHDKATDSSNKNEN